jgi:hypothetical protein
VVKERRRPCTTPCIFGIVLLRTASTNLARGCIDPPSGDFGDFGERGRRASTEDDGVVRKFAGRMSRNVEGGPPLARGSFRGCPSGSRQSPVDVYTRHEQRTKVKGFRSRRPFFVGYRGKHPIICPWCPVVYCAFSITKAVNLCVCVVPSPFHALGQPVCILRGALRCIQFLQT